MIKLNHFYKIFKTILIIIIIFYSNSIYSKQNIEQKVKELTLKLRCMTCQNQSVYDSDSDFSKKITQIIEEKFKEGKNEKEIVIILTERYGEYILLKPLFNKKNIVLWLFPFVLLLISIVFFVKHIKKRES